MRNASVALLALVLVASPVVATRAQTAQTAQTAPAAPAAASHADYSGTWVLDTIASDHGPMLPSKMTLKIAQSPASIVVDREQTNQMGESTSTLTYTLDGTTSKNQLNFGGNPVDISTDVAWEAESPVFTSAMKFGDNDAHSVEKWSLGDSGKTLTIDRKIDAGGQSFESKLVLKKR
jgi:hypothetical protein